VQTSTQ